MTNDQKAKKKISSFGYDFFQESKTHKGIKMLNMTLE